MTPGADITPDTRSVITSETGDNRVVSYRQESIVLQRKAGTFLVKRINDELFAKPEAAPDATTPVTSAPPPAPPVDDLDGQMVHDEEKRPVGTAHRVPGIAIYVVFDGYGHPDKELARCIDDPGTRVMFQHTDRGQITGVIYVPDPTRAPQRAEGMRSDDV